MGVLFPVGSSLGAVGFERNGGEPVGRETGTWLLSRGLFQPDLPTIVLGCFSVMRLQFLSDPYNATVLTDCLNSVH